jgi:DNA-binding MarR family transcriptional regulator
VTNSDYHALAEFRYQICRFLRFSEQAARAEGLEAQQHQYMLVVQAVSQEEAPTIGQVAERLLIHHHSAVGLADRLEERGYLERIRGAGDRRQVRVRLTPQGAAILKRLSALHRRELHQSGPELVAALQALLQGISPEREEDALETSSPLKGEE